MIKRTGRWTTEALIATERGQRFDEWTTRISGGGTFNQGTKADYDGDVLNWRNNSGASVGTAEWRDSYANLTLETDASYEDAHTVHLRVNTATNATNAIALGPATTLHAGSGPGNCYFAKAEASGSVHIYEMVSGTPTSLANASATVIPGDVLSLAYRWDISGAVADLSVMVNGTVVASTTDASFRMSTVSGLPGVFGDDTPSTGTAVMGFWSSEWWVTNGYETYSELRRQLPDVVGGLSLQIMQHQRYTDSTTDKIKHLIIGGLEKVVWTFSRIGGCKTLDASFLPDSTAARYFEDPSFADYVAGDWMGGDVLLNIRYDVSEMADDVSDALWRGRIVSIKRDPDTGMVDLSAEGLFDSLRETVLEKDYTNTTIRNIIVDIIDQVSKGPTSSGKDGIVVYNPAKIVGVDSVLDLKIDLEVKWETAASVLETLAGYMPSTIVYGVDRDGEFYLDQQYETYDEDGVHPGVQTFFVGQDQIEKWSVATDLRNVRSTVLVLGKEEGEDDEEKTRVKAQVTCDLSREFFGNRTKVVNNSEIPDEGLAGKVAAAESKKISAPAINGELETVGLIQGQYSFWQSLVVSAPSVAINLKRAQSGGEYFLRRYGDMDAYSVKEKGSSGAVISLPAGTIEQALNTGYLIHCALTFPFAHPGSSGDSAFLFGRPATSGATDHGWMSVYWYNTNGTDGTILILWTSASASVRQISTGISVPVAGGVEVHLTIHRDASGVFRIYNGNSLTTTDSTHTAQVHQSTANPWKWFTCPNSAIAGVVDGDFGFEEFWVVITAYLGVGIEYDNSNQVTGFIARNHDQHLHRNDAFGLLTYGRFTDEKASAATTSTYPVFQLDASFNPTLGTATYTKSLAGSTVDGAPISTGNVNGYRMDSSNPKRWGGPAIFNAEQVRYEIMPHDGTLRRKFTLGRIPTTVFSSLAEVERQVQRASELLNRTPPTI